MSTVLGGIPFSDAGALQVQLRPDTGVPSSEPVNGGWAIASALNSAYFEPAGAAVPSTAVILGGIAFTQDGAIYLTQSTTGTFADIGGHKVRSDGALLVVNGTPTIGTDPVIGGWAHVGSSRAAYVGGDGLSFALPLRDLGSGAVDTTLAIGTGTATFTRATAAAAKLSTGLWKLDVASGTARSSYLGMNTAVGAYGGYLAEGARTNLCLQSRDLSNASWTKVNTTAAKDQTGIDGVGNSASSLTATLGGGTCLQTITEAATDSTFSMFIKRITGTGTITIQQGASTTEVSGQINSSTYTQVVLDATVLNPAIGIVLGTNGDKIAVDCVQFENGAFASTPIPTTTVAVTRNADVLTFVAAGNIATAIGTAYAEITTESSTTGNRAIIWMNSSNERPIYMPNGGAATKVQAFDGTLDAVSGAGTTSMNAASPIKVASSWGNGSSAIQQGGTVGTAAFDGTMASTGPIGIGSDGAGANQLFGTTRNVRIWSRQLPDGVLQSVIT